MIMKTTTTAILAATCASLLLGGCATRTPAGTGKAVRDLDPGMMLYPTGNKEGVMWEVEDELGNKGWVSSSLVQLAR